MDAEQAWLAQKEQVKTAIKELLAVGISLETARLLAGWNSTLEYENYSDLQGSASLTAQPGPSFSREFLQLRYSRSNERTNSSLLDGAVLDAGVTYAVFIPDIPDLQIDSIVFKLNGAPVHTESSVPWDYAGTGSGDVATKVPFSAGVHIISAEVADLHGVSSIEASFTVE